MKEINSTNIEWLFSGIGTEILKYLMSIFGFIIAGKLGYKKYKKYKNSNTLISDNGSVLLKDVKVGNNLNIKLNSAKKKEKNNDSK